MLKFPPDMQLVPKSLRSWIANLLPKRPTKSDPSQLMGLYLDGVNGRKPRLGGIPDALRRKDGKFSQNRQRV